MKKLYRLTSVILCVIGVGVYIDAHAQCTVPAPTAYVACGSTGQTVFTGSINSGSYFYSTTGTFTGGSINGGNLYICGSLTLSATNYYGGEIFIEPGGSLTISGGTSSIGLDIVNYGSLTIDPSGGSVQIYNPIWNYNQMNIIGSATFDGTANFYNALTSSSLVVSGNLQTDASSVNNGNITVGGLYDLQGGGLCFGGGSTFATRDFFDAGYLITVTPNGANTTATLGITDSLVTDNPITTSTKLVLCDAPGQKDIDSPGTSPVVHRNCTVMTLPVTLISFTAEAQNNICQLQWSATQQTGLANFEVQSSTDAVNYETLTTVPAEQETVSYSYTANYSYTTAITQNTWFRLKMVNDDGSYTYSYIIPVAYLGSGGSSGSEFYVLHIQPNLITDNTLQVWSNMSSPQSGEWWIVDMLGRTVLHQPVQLSQGVVTTSIQLPFLSSGMYHLLFVGSQIKSAPVAFSVIR